MLEHIPNELKSLPYWIGHKNKIPINLKTGDAASSTDPSTWTTFWNAQSKYSLLRCDGLGFVIRPPYIGVDLDDCMTNGNLNDFASNIRDLLNSYTELSPSKTGIHILCKGSIERSYIKKLTKEDPNALEIYNIGRYFTMTGNALNSLPISERTREIHSLLPPQPSNEPSNQPGWISETLRNLQPGNFHNQFIKVIGKLHQNRWTKDDIYLLLEPHARRVGSDVTALKQRIESITRYPVTESSFSFHTLQQNDDTYSISSFLDLDESVTWIVPGMVANQSLGFVAGLPENNKTWICMDLAIECAKGGGYWLKKFPVSDTKVLYIDQERWKGETKRRFKALIEGKNLKGSQLDGRLFIKSGTSIRIDLQRSFEAFKREIDRIKPGLIIVDSYATFNTKEENNRKDTQEVLERVKLLRTECKCAFMFIDHENKSVLSDEDKTPSAMKMVGSVGKPAAAEYVFTVRKEDDHSSMVYMTKNTLGKAVEPFLVKVEDLTEDRSKISVRGY